MKEAASHLAGLLTRQHRRLDDLLGRFLASSEKGDSRASQETILVFDELLRRHAAIEEEQIFESARRGKLLPLPDEGERERLFRELRLEHVQLREVSGMIVRLLAEKEDLPSARRLLPNLLSRWDVHTGREERELFPDLEERMDAEKIAQARRALSDGEDLPPPSS